MTRLDARLSWTLLLRPPRPVVDSVAWPGVLRAAVPELALPEQDPLQAVLDGAFGRTVLHRSSIPDLGTLVVGGLGDRVALSVSAIAPGEIEERDPHAPLRAAALAFLGLEAAFGGDDAALAEALGSAEGPWAVDGLVEVTGQLLEGLPEDLDADLPGAELGRVTLVRGGGVGAGHIAWSAQGTYMRTSERPVAEHGLRSLFEGHLGRNSPLVAYGAAALRFGQGLSRGQRQIAALDGLLPQVEAACAWASAGGAWPGAGEGPDLARLGARLELLKVGLRESHEALRVSRRELTVASERALAGATADPRGPFVEASERGSEALERLAARESSVARWAQALALASRALTNSSDRAL